MTFGNTYVTISSISDKRNDEESTQHGSFTEKSRLLRGMDGSLWKMASEWCTEL